MKSTVHATEEPQAVRYTARHDGYADVWLRKNITQETVTFDGAETTEYVYDEVFFRTTSTQGEIEADIDSFWNAGETWEPSVPLTKEEQQAEKILALEAELEQTKTDNNMAIAELTILMSTMVNTTV